VGEYSEVLKKVKKSKELKFCVKCGGFKALTEFYKDETKKDGRGINCKAYRSKYAKKYCEDHKEAC